MNARKQKEKDRRRARKLADEAWQAVEVGDLGLGEKIIRRAVSSQTDNPLLWNDESLILVLPANEGQADRAGRSRRRQRSARRGLGGAAGAVRLGPVGGPSHPGGSRRPPRTGGPGRLGPGPLLVRRRRPVREDGRHGPAGLRPGRLPLLPPPD